jgi:hypothetical protein
MADTVRKVNYCYVTVPNRAGEGAKVLGSLKEAGVNLLAYSGFPASRGKSQLDLVAEDLAEIRRVARKQGWDLSPRKRALMVQGTDEIGAVERQVRKLGEARINVTAADAVCAGEGRYGMILWVEPKDYARAAKVLGAV